VQPVEELKRLIKELEQEVIVLNAEMETARNLHDDVATELDLMIVKISEQLTVQNTVLETETSAAK
jgi:hypothetical protein